MTCPAPPITRFAPSPTGLLHLGHAFAALVAHDAARAQGGQFLLRLEDLDQGRVRTAFEAALYEDLAWLGLSWPAPVMRQSQRGAAYEAALARLDRMGLVYPCFCTRKDIAAEIARSGAAPHGPDGPVYPGLCRGLDRQEAAARRAAGEPHALRLDLAKAMSLAGPGLAFTELGAGPAGERGTIVVDPAPFGDVVLARKDAPASYHLAVVVDDAAQGVTLVTRGEDLFASTHVHRLLQALLDLPVPRYRHHRLIRDEAGRRLAKRDAARGLASLRAAGWSPAQVRAAVGLPGVETDRERKAGLIAPASPFFNDPVG